MEEDMLASFPRTPLFKAPQPRKIHYPSPALSNYFSDDDQSGLSPVDPSPLSHTHHHSRSHLISHSPRSKVTNHTFLLPASDTPSPVQMSLATRVQKISHQILTRDLDLNAKTMVEAKLDELERNLNAPDVQSKEEVESDTSALFINSESEADEDVQRSAYDQIILDHEEELRDQAHIEKSLRADLDRMKEKAEILLDSNEQYLEAIRDKDSKLRQQEIEINLIREENLDLVCSLKSANQNLFLLSRKFEDLESACNGNSNGHVENLAFRVKSTVYQVRSQKHSIAHSETSLSEDGEDTSTIVTSDKEQESQADCGCQPYEILPDPAASPYRNVNGTETVSALQQTCDVYTQTDECGLFTTKPGIKHETDGSVNGNEDIPEGQTPWQELWQGLIDLAGGVRQDD